MLLLFLLLFSVICNILFALHCRALGKVSAMSEQEKKRLLTSLTQPAGFYYQKREDIFTSTLHPWQRNFGYQSLYDQSAPWGQMVFDCEPVYFNYDQRTWLIEFWKGQYGICTGAEVGIYHADTLVAPETYSHTLFQAVADDELPLLGLELWKDGRLLFKFTRPHWWLTGFRLGIFTPPERLRLKVSITFYDSKMANAFLASLSKLGYDHRNVDIVPQEEESTKVIVHFNRPKTKQPCSLRPRRCAIAQFLNRLLIRIYVKITKPFQKTTDKVLYLYFFLPFAFRRLILLRKPAAYTGKQSGQSRKNQNTFRSGRCNSFPPENRTDFFNPCITKKSFREDFSSRSEKEEK